MKAAIRATAAVAALALSDCTLESTAPSAEVEHAWVRMPAVPGRPAAGYFRVEINGSRETLLGVSSPSAQRIELHHTTNEAGLVRMQRVEQWSTQQSRPIVFEPGGTHLMLFGLDPGLRPGDTIEVSFRFLLAPPTTARARLIGPGEAAPDHAAH